MPTFQATKNTCITDMTTGADVLYLYNMWTWTSYIDKVFYAKIKYIPIIVFL